MQIFKYKVESLFNEIKYFLFSESRKFILNLNFLLSESEKNIILRLQIHYLIKNTSAFQKQESLVNKLLPES